MGTAGPCTADMTGPAPEVARVRRAVRTSLADLPAHSLAVVALSGGRDSLALAVALAFEGPRAGLRAGALIVDHGLQPGSAGVARQVAAVASSLDLDPVTVLPVSVGQHGGPEGAAREARYQALESEAIRQSAVAVLLGHTLDDQAETVLMGLARGSGARSLSGMRPRRGVFRRPLLGVDRRTTGAACAAAGLEPWDDPHNTDPAYRRVRVRHEVLPALEREIGPGISQALARTAEQLAEDDAALEQWAAAVLADGELDCARLSQEPVAVRRRVIRRAALAAGVLGTGLRHSQLVDVDNLVTRWRGQGPVDLPGGVRAERSCGRLRFVADREPKE